MPAPTAGGNPKPTGATAKPGLKKKNSKGQKTEKEVESENKQKPEVKKEEKSDVVVEEKNETSKTLA